MIKEQRTPTLIGKEGTPATGEEIQELAETVQNKKYRIRKLTPRECGRLMNVPEQHIDSILEINSNTQAYKQFGNSIVTSVLIAIFSQLHIEGVKPWNDMTEDEICELIGKPKPENED